VRSKEVPRSGDKQGYKIGIKTGTSETYDSSGKYTSDATIASVIGYGRSKKEGSLPEYVVMVRLDGNSLLWGSLDAVPVFTEISNYLLEYLRIEPIK
jgi:cell division protein FtsI/penicillin-binding protein 2